MTPRSSPAISVTRAGRVAIVGRPNVGKSTLLNALIGEPIAITSPHPQTTRTTVRGVSTVGDSQYVWLDAPGFHSPRTELGREMNRAAHRALRDADVAVVLAVAPRDGAPDKFGDADRTLIGQLPPMPTVLAVTKIDRLKDKSRLLGFLQSLSQIHEFHAAVPISAKTGDGLDAFTAEVRTLLPEQPPLFEPDTLSDQPTRFFVAEYVREQILRHVAQEVPHGVAVVVERFDESEQVVVIDVTVHASREGHKKILVGAEGKMVKRITSAARTRIERLLAREVRLNVRVRVTAGWMDDASRLRALGYGEGSSDS
jgi:GTP-binding protein Era